MEKTELQLALEKLAEVNKDFNEKAKYAFPKILSASRTIKLMVNASRVDWRKVLNKHTGNMEWKNDARSSLNALKRPPVALTALLFKKK